MSSTALLKTARISAGLSQRELAEISGVAQPRIAEIESGKVVPSQSRVEQLLAAFGNSLTYIPSTTPPVWKTAALIGEVLESDDEDLAWRLLIQLSDNLVAADPAVRVALSVAAPASTSNARFDALIAAVVDYRLSVDGLPLPIWVLQPERILESVWHVEPVQKLQSKAESETPPAIRRHGIFMAASELASV